MPPGRPNRPPSATVKPFAWHGVRLDIPVDWDVGLLEGHADRGFARIDDPDMPRLELRWQEAPGRFDIDRALDRYFQALRKAARKAGQTIEAKPRSGIGPQRRGLQTRGFRWRGPQEAIGCLVYNPGSRRVIVAQALTAAGPYGNEATGRQVLATLADGPEPDGLQTWAVYDFVVRLLPEFGLVQHSLKTGAFQFVFQSRRGRIAVFRWALADLLLARHGGDMLQWWQSGSGARAGRDRDQVSDVEVAGHAAKQVVRHRRSLLGLARPTAVFLWHCPQSNQLLRVEVTARQARHWEELKRQGWQVLCHRL